MINAKSRWINAGYELFAAEGAEGIQIERLARILHLNKSGFYHYFQTHDNFLIELFTHHRSVAQIMAEETRHCKTLDPDYFRIIEKYKHCVLAQGQLSRKTNHTLFYNTLHDVREIVEIPLLPLWCKFFNLPDDPNLVLRHFALFRNAFYAQATLDNITFDMLHTTMAEIGMMISDLLEHAKWNDKSLHTYDMLFANKKQA